MLYSPITSLKAIWWMCNKKYIYPRSRVSSLLFFLMIFFSLLFSFFIYYLSSTRCWRVSLKVEKNNIKREKDIETRLQVEKMNFLSFLFFIAKSLQHLLYWKVEKTKIFVISEIKWEFFCSQSHLSSQDSLIIVRWF